MPVNRTSTSESADVPCAIWEPVLQEDETEHLWQLVNQIDQQVREAGRCGAGVWVVKWINLLGGTMTSSSDFWQGGIAGYRFVARRGLTECCLAGEGYSP